MAEQKHLWEVEHPYHNTPDHYWGTGNTGSPNETYESFDDFLAVFGDADPDMNLVFRWDWEEPKKRPTNRNDNYRDGKLEIMFFMQRKGYHAMKTIKVCRADEPAVIEYLTPKLNHLLFMWLPLTGVAKDANKESFDGDVNHDEEATHFCELPE